MPPQHDGPLRYVAVGDSFTEGLHDVLAPDGRHRGWADRVASGLAAHHGGLRYANLAVRGRLLHQVADQQVPAAIDLSPDLVSFHAGANDVLRPGLDVDDLVGRFEQAVGRLRRAGSEVVLFTVIGRSGGRGRLVDTLTRRFTALNDGVREIADRHGAILVDLAPVTALGDPRLWAEDRLHLNPDGHGRVAAAVLETLGVRDGTPFGAEDGWWRQPLPAVMPPGRAARMAVEWRWTRRHLAPWVLRRLRGVSSGDTIVAKRPRLDDLPPLEHGAPP